MDYKQLYEKAAVELEDIKAELVDFNGCLIFFYKDKCFCLVETSKLIEDELESELETSTKRTKELEKENVKLKDEIAELKVGF